MGNHPLRSLNKLLDRLLFQRVDQRSLGYMRIAFGLILVFEYLMLADHWGMLFGKEGIMAYWPIATNPYSHGFYFQRDLFSLTNAWLPTFAYWMIALVAALSLLWGFQTRIATILLFIFQVSMTWFNPLAINGEDLILKFALFYAIFLPLWQRPSLDAVASSRHAFARWCRGAAPHFEIWPLRLLQISTCMVYAVSTFYKCKLGNDWLNGDALYWTAINETWSRFPGTLLFATRITSAIGTYGSLLIEGLFPIMVCFRFTRRLWIPITISLQIMIVILVDGVAFFSLSMAALNLAFLTNDDLDFFRRAWRRKINFRGRQARLK